MLFQPDGPKGQQQEAQEDPEPQEAKEIRGRWNPATGGGETGKSCSSIALPASYMLPQVPKFMLRQSNKKLFFLGGGGKPENLGFPKN